MGSPDQDELSKLVEAAHTLVEDSLRRGFRSEGRPAKATSTSGGVGTALGPGKDLSAVRAELGECTRCKLHQGRAHIVFGVGDPHAALMFVGEAPGRDEDMQGEPFVGRAGKLLTDIIEAIGLTRREVYICNVIKCRPPENRNPEPDEIERCEPFLKAQIDSVRPKLICTLGKFAAQTLLKVETPISKLRGKFFEYNGVPLMPTYHPAFLLRNPSSKKEVWEDMKLLHAELCRLTGKPIQRKGR
ncbi:MAG: uracil-DNA glycosylase [Pseudomonadota bacterium]